MSSINGPHAAIEVAVKATVSSKDLGFRGIDRGLLDPVGVEGRRRESIEDMLERAECVSTVGKKQHNTEIGFKRCHRSALTWKRTPGS